MNMWRRVSASYLRMPGRPRTHNKYVPAAVKRSRARIVALYRVHRIHQAYTNTSCIAFFGQPNVLIFYSFNELLIHNIHKSVCIGSEYPVGGRAVTFARTPPGSVSVMGAARQPAKATAERKRMKKLR